MQILDTFPLVWRGGNELASLAPLFFLAFGGLFALLVAPHKTKGHGLAFSFAVATLLICIFQGAGNLTSEDVSVLGNTLVYNTFTRSIGLMIMSFALIAAFLSYGNDKKENLLPEMYGLILFSTAGMLLMVSTSHLLFMFIALEIMSLAIYVLVAMRRTSRFSSEASLKYFILGGLGSAFLLYGASLIFGATGSFELTNIRLHLINHSQPTFIYFVGLGLVTVAMLFKVGAVPFHGWVPDVYQGATTSVTGFMGAAVKMTAFIAFARIAQNLVFVDNVPQLSWFVSFIWIIAAASMIYGNFVAISQTEIKRMLSFSTIAHTGYLLLGICVLDKVEVAQEALVLYLFFYGLSNLGAFAIISQFEERNQKDLTLNQIAGMGLRHPILGLFLTMFLLSMAGIPLTSGFIGKYGLFSAAVAGGEVPLVVIAVLTSVVSMYYYLRVIVYMFMKENEYPVESYRMKGATLAAALSAAATLQFGLFPQGIIQFVKMIAR